MIWNDHAVVPPSEGQHAIGHKFGHYEPLGRNWRGNRAVAHGCDFADRQHDDSGQKLTRQRPGKGLLEPKTWRQSKAVSKLTPISMEVLGKRLASVLPRVRKAPPPGVCHFADERFLNEYDLNLSIISFDLRHELFLMNISKLSCSAGRIFTFRDAREEDFVLPTAGNELVACRCMLRSRQWPRARKFLLRVGDGLF